MARYFWRNNYSYKRNLNNEHKSVKNKENVLLELDCLIHGPLKQMKYGKDKLKIYQALNENKNKFVNKCYFCLEDKISKSNREKEKIKEVLNENHKQQQSSWAGFNAFLFFAGTITVAILLMESYFILGTIALFISCILLKFGAIQLKKIDKLKESEFEKLTNHLPKYSNALSYVEECENKINSKKFIPYNLNNTESPKRSNSSYSMENIDKMSGIDFELFIKELLILKYYERVKVTKASADNGIDIIAYKDNKKIGIQCKRYKRKITNKAIQEVYSGKDFYECDEAYVITNSYFTDNAKIAAKKLNVILIDRFDLLKWIEESRQK